MAATLNPMMMKLSRLVTSGLLVPAGPIKHFLLQQMRDLDEGSLPARCAASCSRIVNSSHSSSTSSLMVSPCEEILWPPKNEFLSSAWPETRFSFDTRVGLGKRSRKYLRVKVFSLGTFAGALLPGWLKVRLLTADADCNFAWLKELVLSLSSLVLPGSVCRRGSFEVSIPSF